MMRHNTLVWFITQLLLASALTEISIGETQNVNKEEDKSDAIVSKPRDCADCKIEQNPNDSAYLTMAQKSMRKYVENQNSLQHHKIMKVKNVTTQALSGIITTIDFDATPTNCTLNEKDISICEVLDESDYVSCRAKIIKQIWLKKKEIIITCENKRRSKRQISGGVKEENPNNPTYIGLAQESLQKYAQNNGLYTYNQLLQVKRVTTQTVAGTLITIDFDAIVGFANVISCHSVIWQQEWLNKKEINVTCNNIVHQKDGAVVPGGLMERNVNDPFYIEMARESLKKYVQENGLPQFNQLLQVKKVTTQAVAGSITRIDFLALLNFSNIIDCHSEILEQPWLKKKEINVTCRNVSNPPIHYWF